MKIGIYSPYLDSFGGGERYILTIAETLSFNHDVDLLLDDHQLSLDPVKLVSDLGQHLNLNLSKIKLVKAPLGRGLDFWRRFFFWKKYDILIYLSDGSIFYSTAKKSFIHFQVPFQNKQSFSANKSMKSLWGNIKLSSWKLAICNSIFTETHIKKTWPIKTLVIYPPVEIDKIKPLKKEKYILSVGRFVSFTKSKKHEDMIKTFLELCESNKLSGWSLHLAGSVEGDEEYLNELKKLAKDAPVFFYPNLSFKELINLYGKSSIYWHAAGFGETDPTRMEHFGITTVEAMAAGCIPVVINKGGQTEIVEDGQSGYLWETLAELKKLTIELIGDKQLRERLSKESQKRSRKFSKEKFQERIKKLICDDQ